MTEVINETDYEINEAEFSALADYVLDQMHVSSDAEVNIIFIDPEALPKLMAAGTIEVAPLAYMRGRTLNDSFIILDEAQNTTVGQMKMFLTRLGFGSKVVVTGDASQVDLPGTQTSGLSVVENILGDIDDIEFCRLTSADVVRHELVGAIIDAYQRYDDRNAARRARTRSHNTARREYTS